MAGGDGGSDRTLIKIAIFAITVSIMSTCLVSLYVSGSSDYDYDTIQGYRSELIEFSGGQLTNDNPWVLTHVYTPFEPSMVNDSEIEDHIEYDTGRSTGWLFGEEITTYPDLGEVVNIHLDKNQRSSQLLTVGDPQNFTYQNGRSWWAGGNEFGITIVDPDVIRGFVNHSMFSPISTLDENYGYEMANVTANNWNYTGYRYVFDPILPFSQNASSKDGRLSLVWYQLPDASDTGLSGALEVYGGSSNGQVLLGRISATEIISTFQSTSGYVSTFDFDFEGVHLNLTINFPPNVYSQYSSLKNAWDDGAWTMAISSTSAGNFFDVENSNAFNITAGNMLDTFIDIYTFDYPHFDDPWVEIVMWLLVGLPMSLALLLITARLVGGVFKIF